MKSKASKALVIYDAPSAQVRRIIVAEDDSHYEQHHLRTVGHNEAYTYLYFDGAADFRSSLAKAQEAVLRATGRKPTVF